MSLSKLLPNVGETLTVNRASRSHARKVTGSAAKRSGRCVMLELLKERGVPGGEGTAIIPDRTPADR